MIETILSKSVVNAHDSLSKPLRMVDHDKRAKTEVPAFIHVSSRTFGEASCSSVPPNRAARHKIDIQNIENRKENTCKQMGYCESAAKNRRKERGRRLRAYPLSRRTTTPKSKYTRSTTCKSSLTLVVVLSLPFFTCEIPGVLCQWCVRSCI